MKRIYLTLITAVSIAAMIGCAGKQGATTAAEGADEKAAAAKEEQMDKAEAKEAKASEKTKKAMASDSDVKVINAEVCRSVENRAPVGAGESFPADIGQVYLYTKVAVEGGTESAIKHVWKYNDEEQATVRLPVRGSGWRTYSSKNIEPSQKGAWSVEITTDDDKIIETLAFSVK